MNTQPTKKDMMERIPLTPQTVELFRDLVEHPENHKGCNYKPIRECFKKSDTCTPQHILFKHYYLGGCIYEDRIGKLRAEPYCDYGPNSPLADLLLKAGVPEERVGGICPWKTGITINERDNSVIIRGYQTERFI